MFKALGGCLYMKNMLIIDIKKLISVIAICSLTPACSGMSYLDNKGVQEVKAQYDLYDKPDENDYMPKEFGAIMLSVNSSDPDDAPQLFFLRREKNKYYAQTLLFDQSDDNKAMFKRTYLNFGIDSKSKGMLTKLTMKF